VYHHHEYLEKIKETNEELDHIREVRMRIIERDMEAKRVKEEVEL
jgi:hypothetical protein